VKALLLLVDLRAAHALAAGASVRKLRSGRREQPY